MATENLIKISAYEWFNHFFPGVLFISYLIWSQNLYLNPANIADGVILFCDIYFVGLVISRLGSLIVQPIAKRIKLIEWSTGYYEAEKNDPKLKTLLKDFNLFRNVIATDLLCIFVTTYQIIVGQIERSVAISTIVVEIVILVIFLASYQHQSKYIINRINNSKRIKNEKISSF